MPDESYALSSLYGAGDTPESLISIFIVEG